MADHDLPWLLGKINEFVVILDYLHSSLWSKRSWNQIAEAKAIIFGTVITVAVGYGQSCGLSNFSIYPLGVCVLSPFPFSTMGRICRRDSIAAAWLKMMCFSASRCGTNGTSNTPEAIHAMSNDSNLFELSMYKNSHWTRYPIIRYPSALPRELNNSTSPPWSKIDKCMIPKAHIGFMSFDCPSTQPFDKTHVVNARNGTDFCDDLRE